MGQHCLHTGLGAVLWAAHCTQPRANAAVQVWTLISGLLKPILRIGERMAPSRGVVVCEQLGALCTAHIGGVGGAPRSGATGAPGAWQRCLSAAHATQATAVGLIFCTPASFCVLLLLSLALVPPAAHLITSPLPPTHPPTIC